MVLLLFYITIWNRTCVHVKSEKSIVFLGGGGGGGNSTNCQVQMSPQSAKNENPRLPTTEIYGEKKVICRETVVNLYWKYEYLDWAHLFN